MKVIDIPEQGKPEELSECTRALLVTEEEAQLLCALSGEAAGNSITLPLTLETKDASLGHIHQALDNAGVDVYNIKVVYSA